MHNTTRVSGLDDYADTIVTIEIWQECVFCRVSFEIYAGPPGESMRLKDGDMIPNLGRSVDGVMSVGIDSTIDSSGKYVGKWGHPEWKEEQREEDKVLRNVTT